LYVLNYLANKVIGLKFEFRKFIVRSPYASHESLEIIPPD